MLISALVFCAKDMMQWRKCFLLPWKLSRNHFDHYSSNAKNGPRLTPMTGPVQQSRVMGRSDKELEEHEEDHEQEIGEGEESSHGNEQVIRFSPEFDYGRNRLALVQFPNPILNSLKRIMKESSNPYLKDDCSALVKHLSSYHRKGPKGSDEHQETKEEGDQEPKDSPIEYGARVSLAYALVQSPYCYATIKKILHETKKRLGQESFFPFSILDFGTGPGTALWAANELWGESIKMYTGIDTSESMLDLADTILTDANGDRLFPVHFRRYLSFAKDKQRHDIVIAAYSLSEIRDEGTRRLALENLWQHTESILILVERGSPEGFQIIKEARDRLLKENESFKGDRKAASVGRERKVGQGKHTLTAATLAKEDLIARESSTEQRLHVLAPCPQDGACPMSGSWCHFSQRLQLTGPQLSLLGYKEPAQDQKYSYVVFKRGPRPDSVEGLRAETTPQRRLFQSSHRWSRIVAPPYKRARHVIMDICSSNEQLERVVVPKSQGKSIYYDARKAQWGDLWPHPPKARPIVHSDFSKKGRNRTDQYRPNKQDMS